MHIDLKTLKTADCRSGTCLYFPCSFLAAEREGEDSDKGLTLVVLVAGREEEAEEGREGKGGEGGEEENFIVSIVDNNSK